MGWKGNARLAYRVVRAVQRDSAQRQRHFEAQRKQNAKLEAQEAARLEVAEFENYLEVIQTVHKDCSENTDWNSISAVPRPKKPIPDDTASKKAEKELADFKPSLVNKLFGGEARQREKLQAKLDQILDSEKLAHQKSLETWNQDLTDWQEMVSVANGVLVGNLASYKAAILEMKPFEEIESFGSGLTVSFKSANELGVTFIVHDEKVIPKQQKSLLASGKLSKKDIPIGRRNEIYQDYVCSSALRIGRELMAVLPIEQVIVNANGDLLNSVTGRLESQTILSVKLIRDTMAKIDFDRIDPSDSMKNFVCNMDFKKGQGMSPVKPLS
jgi:hypothetical protein